MKRYAVAAAALGVLAGLSFGSVGAQAQDIVIGLAGPITGANATFGDQMKRGAQMAVADINAKGGLLGKKIALEIGDDACEPKQASAVANQLATKKAVAVMGHFCSSSSIPASDVYMEEGVLQITPASTNPLLTERGAKYKYVFRTCGRDDKQGLVAGTYLADKFKGKGIAIIHDKSAYGKGLADETKAALNKAGQTEKLYEAITAGDKDFTALVSKMKSAGIEAIYFGGYHTEAGLIIRQAREQGLSAQMLSGDALATNEFWAIAGKAGEGVMMTFEPDARKFGEAAEVTGKFKASGFDPEGYTLNTYAAMQVYYAAATEAKSTKPEDVAKVMRSKSFETVLGKLEFDDKGDLKNPKYVFYVFKDGKYAEM